MLESPGGQFMETVRNLGSPNSIGSKGLAGWIRQEFKWYRKPKRQRD